jgi:hypothetical protein
MLFFSNFSMNLPIYGTSMTKSSIYYIALLLCVGEAHAATCHVTTANATGAGSISSAIEQAYRGECRTTLDEASRRRYEIYAPLTASVHVIRISKSAVIALTQSLPELYGVGNETLVIQAIGGATIQFTGKGYTDTQAPLRISGYEGNVIVDGIGLQDFAQTALQIEGRDHLVIAGHISGSGSTTASALRIAGTHNSIAESTISGNLGDAIRVEDCQGNRIAIVKNIVGNNAGAGLRIRATAVDVRDNDIHHNHGAGIAVDDKASTCKSTAGEIFTAELRRNAVHHNAEGVVIPKMELVPPVDLIEVSAPTASSYRIIGNIGRNSAAAYPWDDAHLNLKDAIVDIFVTNDAKSRQAVAYVGSTSIYDVSKRLFIATIPKPLIINGKEITNPIFVATLTDPEHHNSSRYSDPLDVVGRRDWDKDGIPNIQEDLNQDGAVSLESGETDPRLPDSDGDGLTDGTELLHRIGFEEKLKWAKEEYLSKDHVVTAKISFKDLSRLDPSRADSDEDCLPDGLELGVVSFEFPAVAKVEYSTLQAPPLLMNSGCLEILKAHQLYQVDLTAPEKSTLTIKNSLLRDKSKPATLANVIGIYDMDPSTHTDPTNKDSDNDRLMDGAEDWNWDGKGDTTETDAKSADSDKDGLADGDEDRNGNSIADKDETSPLLADSDHDGVADAQEVKTGANPMHCDSDGDGEPDGIENNIPNENAAAGCPGAPTGGSNFANPSVLSSSSVDSDRDGLKDGDEDANHNGWLDPNESDPTTVDTDGDGITDDVEMTGDTDHNGTPDFFVGDIDNGGKCHPPISISDVDCDGLSNAQDSDSDNDGCPDRSEGLNASNTAHNIPAVYTRESKQCNGNGGASTPAASPKPSNGNGSGATASGSAKPSETSEPTSVNAKGEPIGSWNSFWAGRTDGGGSCSLMRSNSEQPPDFQLFLLAGLLLGMLVTARNFA